MSKYMGWYTLDENEQPVQTDDFPKNKNTDVWPRLKDEVGEFVVSTVFLALDHNFSGEGDPVLWETMVFPPDSYIEEYCDRYTSADAARRGHEQVVTALRNGADPSRL